MDLGITVGCTVDARGVAGFVVCDEFNCDLMFLGIQKSQWKLQKDVCVMPCLKTSITICGSDLQ